MLVPFQSGAWSPTGLSLLGFQRGFLNEYRSYQSQGICMKCCSASPCSTGFGFLEFEEKDDAAAAIDNMHNSEIYGRVLRVNYAQPMKIKGGDKGWR